MKDYFKGQTINISNKYRKNLVVHLSNIILDKRDNLPPIRTSKIFKDGKRGKYRIRVFRNTEQVKYDEIVGYYDTITSDSQALEHINDSLPRRLKGRMVLLQVGRDNKQFDNSEINMVHWFI